MLCTNSLLRRLLPRLLFQLAPAIVVSAGGIALLSRLAEPPDAPPAAAPAETAVRAEAIFTATPPVAAPPAPNTSMATARVVPRPKPMATHPAHQLASAEPPAQQAENASNGNGAAPLSISPPAQQPRPSIAAKTGHKVMATLRSVGETIQDAPQRALAKVASWFADANPPRPPAEIPAQFL